MELKGPRPGDGHPGLSHGTGVITGSFHVDGEAGESVAEKRCETRPAIAGFSGVVGPRAKDTGSPPEPPEGTSPTDTLTLAE